MMKMINANSGVPGRAYDGLYSIRMTAYRGDEDEPWRYERLSKVISFAAGIAYIKHHVSPDLFLGSLVRVHDHKGRLDCTWISSAAAASFAAVMNLAWEWQREAAENISHFVNGHDASADPDTAIGVEDIDALRVWGDPESGSETHGDLPQYPGLFGGTS